MKRISIIFLLGVLTVVGIAATVNKTPILRGFLQSNLDGNGYAITNVLIDSASYSTNAEFVLTSTLTNQVYASNVVSGGVIPLGAVATNTGWNGSVLVWSNSSRVWSQDGSALTNVPFSIFTNYALAPTEYTNVGALAFGTNLYGMTSFWTFASVPIIGTVPIFNFGIDTNTVITTNGGTFTGTILDNSVSSTAPANNQLVTANWVRGLFAGAGVSYYSTTNINNTFTNADIVTTNIAVYELSTNIPVYSRRVYTAPTNNSYIGQVVTTNTFQQLLSGVTVNAYLEAQNGSGTGGPQVKPEIYVSYDRTNWIGDWDASPQYIPEGATNLYSWVVSNPTYVSTNAGGFYVQRRFKMVTQTSPIASDVLFHLGTNRPSHITLSAADSSSGNAFLAANQAFTGSNTFSGGTMTWGDANKTNGVYIGPVGEVLSNNLGSVTISGGNVTASGMFTGNAGALTNLGNGKLPIPTNNPVAGKVLSATSAGTSEWATPTGGVTVPSEMIASYGTMFGLSNVWHSQNSFPIQESFEGNAINAFWIGSGSVGGASSINTYPSGQWPSGWWAMRAYPTNTGSFGHLVSSAGSATALTNIFAFDCRVATRGIEQVRLIAGCSTGTTSPTDGIMWLANTNWSPNWIAACANNSSWTYVTNGQPVLDSAEYRLSIYANSTGTAYFYTNGILSATIGSNVPISTGRTTSGRFSIFSQSSSGSATAQFFWIDYIWFLYD